MKLDNDEKYQSRYFVNVNFDRIYQALFNHKR